MSVRTKLILIFLGLSVVPLAALTFLSYSNSTRSLRDLVTRDNREAAGDLERRVAGLNQEVNRRVADVSRLPEFQEMDPSRPLEPHEAERLARAMQEEVSDRWSLFSEMEFRPALAPAAPGIEPPPEPGNPPGSPPAQLHQVDQRVRRALGGAGLARNRAEVEETATEGEADWSMKLILPDFASLDEEGGIAPTVKEYNLDFKDGAPTERTVTALAEGVLENLVRLPGFVLQRGDSGRGIRLRNLGEEMERQLMGVTVGSEGGEPALPPDAPLPPPADLRQRRVELLRRLDAEKVTTSQSIEVPVESATGTLGRVVAQIRPERLVASVFEGMRASENEIAFAVDPLGRLHARSPRDLQILQDLGLAQGEGMVVTENSFSAPVQGDAAALRVEDPDWITIVERNNETGYTFGVARVISGEMSDLRQAAALNLFLGLGFIGLAGSGIIVFSGRMTRGLEDLTQGARRLAGGDLAHRLPATQRRDELGQLARAFNEMAGDLEVSRRSAVEQERVRRELEIARGIQADCLPREGFEAGRLQIMGRSIPSREVGGDFFNFISLDEHRHALLIGDVSGKGVPAALLMAEAQGTFRALLQHRHDVDRIVAQMNRDVARNKPYNVFFTVFLGILDCRDGSLVYVNAGQDPPLLLSEDGSLRELSPTGRPVGLYEDSPQVTARVEMQPGDLLALYTDGVTESSAEADAEEFFGRRRLEAALREGREETLEAILNNVGRRLTRFHGKGALEDDATLLLVRLSARSAGELEESSKAAAGLTV